MSNIVGNQNILKAPETLESVERTGRKLRVEKTFARLRNRLVSYHRMRSQSLQPAPTFPSPLNPTPAEVLELASLIKTHFDGSGSKAREALYLMLRYPGVAIAFEDLEIRVIKNAAELQPPTPWEISLNAHCCKKGGNLNPFIVHPNLVVDFNPQLVKVPTS